MSTTQQAKTICELCTKPFTDPRILLCLHSFCHMCLEKELEKRPGDSITCPTCQRCVPLPEGGTAALPKNMHLAFQVEVATYSAAMETASDIKCSSCSVESNGASKAFCCTCREFLCQFCWDYHRASRKLQDHGLVPLTKDAAKELPPRMKPRAPTCTEHGDALKFYCKACRRPVCPACITGGSQGHAGHSYTSMAVAASDHRREVGEALERAGGTLARLSDDICASDGVLQRVQAMRDDVASRVERDFAILEGALRAKKAAVLAALDKAAHVCGRPPRDRREECLNEMGDIIRCKDVITHALQVHSDDELMGLKGILAFSLDSVLSASEKVLSSSLQFTPTIATHTKTNRILEEIEKIGVLVVCPSKSTWTQVYTSPPMVDTQYRVKLECKDSKGDRMTMGGLEVRGELRPKMDDQPCVTGEVEDHGDGTYTITLTPPTTGHYQLSITIHGHNVLNSPCDIRVFKSYKCWKGAEMTIAVQQPFFVALDNGGNIYVTCAGRHPICVFDASGTPTHTIGERGSGKGQFNNPRGIAIQGDVMYVADYSNNRIQKLTTRGEFMLAFGHEKSGESSPLKGPLGVCVDREGRVVVADYNNNRVQLYSPEGVCWCSINGSVDGRPLVCPCAVAVDPQGNIHVAAKPDVKNGTTVTVFGPKGTYIRNYGTLRNAMSIGVHSGGQTVVCEYGNKNAVQIFDPRGGQLGAVQAASNVFALAIDQDCNLYVTMHEANQLAKY